MNLNRNKIIKEHNFRLKIGICYSYNVIHIISAICLQLVISMITIVNNNQIMINSKNILYKTIYILFYLYLFILLNQSSDSDNFSFPFSPFLFA